VGPAYLTRWLSLSTFVCLLETQPCDGDVTDSVKYLGKAGLDSVCIYNIPVCVQRHVAVPG
jgi:hypothetical protein